MRIFISHGTDLEKPGEVAFLERLDALLGKPGADGAPAHAVLLDRTRIGAGDDWLGVLHDALAECQAAVLLLGPRALGRPWVQKEAAILSFRKQRESAFQFFCVLLPGVVKEDLDRTTAFAALQLNSRQMFTSPTSAEDVAAWIRARVDAVTVPIETPIDRLQSAVEAQLEKVKLSQLEALCAKLLGEPVDWVASADRLSLLARALARGIVRGRTTAVGGVTGLMKALKAAGLGKESRDAIRDLAAPMCIDPEMAGLFGNLLARPPDEARFAALACAQPEFSPLMIAWRASLPDTADFVYPIAGGGSDTWAEELEDKIRETYRKRHRKAPADDASLDRLLRARAEPLVFVLPPPVPDEALMRALHARFPGVVFVVRAGEELPPSSTLPEGVVVLTPALDPDRESACAADYLAADEVL